MEITQISEDRRSITMSNNDLLHSLNHYIGSQGQRGQIKSIERVEIGEDSLTFHITFDSSGVNSDNYVRQSTRDTDAGEVPSTSDVQRMANGLPPRLPKS